MKLLLDTANIDQIRLFMQSTMLAGVTTNPSLMAKESKGDYVEKLKTIAEAVQNQLSARHLSVEVTTLDPNVMIVEAQTPNDALGRNGVDVHIKIPVMMETMRVISTLRRKDVKVNATACMTAFQAKMAMDAGANIVSFFYNRIKDENESPDSVLTLFNQIRVNLEQTKIICGSIREPDDVRRCFLQGADYVTVSPAILQKMIEHPQTTKAIAQFQKDIDSWLS